MTRGAGSRGTGFACEAQRATVSVTDRGDAIGLHRPVHLRQTLPTAYRW